MDRLAADVDGLIRERGARSAALVGHDWGGTVAWATAMNHPEAVERLVILNVPHPRRMLRAMRRPRQLLRSWYMFLFQAPWLPERLLSARRYRALQVAIEDRVPPAPLPPQDLDRYVEAWSRSPTVPMCRTSIASCVCPRRATGSITTRPSAFRRCSSTSSADVTLRLRCPG